MTFTDAETRIYEELGTIIRGEFNVVGISRTEIHDIFHYEECDTWYKCKITFESEGGGDEANVEKKKKVAQNFLVTANSVKDAFEKYNIPKNEQDIMINAIKNAQTAEEAERIVADSLKGISDISQFQKWVKKEWDTDYTGTEKFDKEDEYYTVNDGVIIYYYKKNSDGTFVEDRSKQKKI